MESKNQITTTGFYYYLLGILLSSFIILLTLFSFFEIKLKKAFSSGPITDQKIFCEVSPTDHDRELGSVLRIIPEGQLREDLIQAQAAYDSAYLNDFQDHDLFFFAKENKNSLRELQANAQAQAYYMATTKPYYIDPPVIFLNRKFTQTPTLASYIRKESRSSFYMTTTEDKNRTTLPLNLNDKKILVVGDSAAMGYGVRDEDTFASFLQAKLKNRYQVLNKGISGFETQDIMQKIEEEKDKSYHHIIYILSENDIKSHDSFAELEQIIKQLGAFKPFFKSITLIQNFNMETVLSDFFTPMKTESLNKRIEEMAIKTLRLAKELSINYVSVYDIANEYTQTKKTIFARFGLYADHSHLSPEGNRLVSDHVFLNFFNNEKK